MGWMGLGYTIWGGVLVGGCSVDRLVLSCGLLGTSLETTSIGIVSSSSFGGSGGGASSIGAGTGEGQRLFLLAPFEFVSCFFV